MGKVPTPRVGTPPPEHLRLNTSDLSSQAGLPFLQGRGGGLTLYFGARDSPGGQLQVGFLTPWHQVGGLHQVIPTSIPSSVDREGSWSSLERSRHHRHTPRGSRQCTPGARPSGTPPLPPTGSRSTSSGLVRSVTKGHYSYTATEEITIPVMLTLKTPLVKENYTF